MALGLNIETSQTPIIKYNANAGTIFRVDRKDGHSVSHDITKNFKAIFDFENVQLGWVKFGPRGSNAPPHFILSKFGDLRPPRPVVRESDDDEIDSTGKRSTIQYQECVRLVVKLSKECGGDYRELSGSAIAFKRGIELLHDEYEAEKGNHQGKLPVVILEDRVFKDGTKGNQGTYTPVFKIVSWVDRPADFVPNLRSNEQPNAAIEKQRPPSTGSTKVEAPVKVLADPIVLDDDDFG